MVEGLGLAALDVPLDARGVPAFDPHSMQVANLPVVIAGDVTGERQVRHEAADEGKIAGYNAAHIAVPPLRFRRKTPLYLNFCDPNIIAAAMPSTPAPTPSARPASPPSAARASWDRVAASSASSGTRPAAGCSAARLRDDRPSRRAPGLPDRLVRCIEQDLTVGDLLRMPFYHPVIEGALKTALADLYDKLTVRNSGPIKEVALLGE